MKYIFTSLTFLIVLASLTFSGHANHNYKASGKENSIYYWRTTFSLNDAEKNFIEKHNIKKMYMRFFDVELNHGYHINNIYPNATIIFNDSVPKNIEIVPTIYITIPAIGEMQHNEDEYAEKILKRVNAICRRNGIKYNEMQLDCDWTKNTRNSFFRLCEVIKQHIDSTKTLSSTIRLHQLTQSPPPVDKGVLMVYNTGNLMAISTENSIFSRKDIEPYLRNNALSKYNLPLDVAYPAYGWSLVFYPTADKFHFDRIMQRTDFSSYPQLKRIDNNTYEVTEEINFTPSGKYWDKVYKGNRIRVEQPTAKEILDVKNLIDRQLSDKKHNNIIYHLDNEQLSHYRDHEINEIYHSN